MIAEITILDNMVAKKEAERYALNSTRQCEKRSRDG